MTFMYVESPPLFQLLLPFVGAFQLLAAAFDAVTLVFQAGVLVLLLAPPHDDWPMVG